MGHHPPLLPCGPWEPPRRRSGLGGSTCGTGDRVAATWEGWGDGGWGGGGMETQGTGDKGPWRAGDEDREMRARRDGNTRGQSW